jgi:hypothetical protein
LIYLLRLKPQLLPPYAPLRALSAALLMPSSLQSPHDHGDHQIIPDYSTNIARGVRPRAHIMVLSSSCSTPHI